MKNRARVLVITALLLLGLSVWYPGLRSRRVSAQGPTLKGAYGFSANAVYTGPNSTTLAVVGVMNFDGAGNLTGTETVVQPSRAADATNPESFTLPITGTYTVNADNTGVIKITVPIPNAPEATTAFVLTDGGATAMFVQSGGGNLLLTGTARKQ